MSQQDVCVPERRGIFYHWIVRSPDTLYQVAELDTRTGRARRHSFQPAEGFLHIEYPLPHLCDRCVHARPGVPQGQKLVLQDPGIDPSLNLSVLRRPDFPRHDEH